MCSRWTAPWLMIVGDMTKGFWTLLIFNRKSWVLQVPPTRERDKMNNRMRKTQSQLRAWMSKAMVGAGWWTISLKIVCIANTWSLSLGSEERHHKSWRYFFSMRMRSNELVRWACVCVGPLQLARLQARTIELKRWHLQLTWCFPVNLGWDWPQDFPFRWFFPASFGVLFHKMGPA